MIQVYILVTFDTILIQNITVTVAKNKIQNLNIPTEQKNTSIDLCTLVWMYVCSLPDKIHRLKSSWSVVSVTADRAEILVWSNNEHCFTGSGQIFSPSKF